MLHYVYIKFRARYFHYVSMPTEILSQDFISEFHLLFQQRLLRFLMKLLVHRSFQWFPALIQLHFHWTNDTVLLNLITFSHHIIFLHCFFILKMLKYIQIVSISDSSREETYGNKQHTNFKWGGQNSIVSFWVMSSEITYQVFITLVVPLNKYSKQDLIEKNDELSLIFLINQLQNSSEFHALKDIPKEYTEHLTENT